MFSGWGEVPNVRALRRSLSRAFGRTCWQVGIGDGVLIIVSAFGTAGISTERDTYYSMENANQDLNGEVR